MHVVELKVDDVLDLPGPQVAGSRRGTSGRSRGTSPGTSGTSGTSGGSRVNAARDQADREGAGGQCGDRRARPPVTE
jgi:hypothetical protein